MNRNTSVDFFKYIASLLVVASHTALFRDINDSLYFVTVQVICRLAVPFFAICTGYFMTYKFVMNGGMCFKRQGLKLVILYLIWSVFYLFYSIPSWIETGWFSKGAFIDFAIGAVLSGSHYHLWYLLSLIYAIPLFYLCLRYIKDSRFLLIISIILYTVKVFIYGYRNYLPNRIQEILVLSDTFGSFTNALFLILPLLLLGSIIYHRKPKRKSQTNIIGFICSLLCLTIEATMLNKTGQKNVSFIIFTYVTSYFLFLVILDMKIRINIKLGEVSLIVYCIHPVFAECLYSKIDKSVVLFMIVALISTIVGIGYINLKNWLKNIKYVK